MSCSGLGGSLKRLAHNYCHNVSNEINNAQEFSDFVQSQETAHGEKYKTLPIVITEDDVRRNEEKYHDRWNEKSPSGPKTIPGTQKFHDMRSVENNDRYILARNFSYSDECQRMPIYKN